MNKKRNEEALATPPAQEDQEYFETKNLLSPYRPSIRTDAPLVTIPTTVHVTLVAPKKPKYMTISQNIMPQLVNLTFKGSNTSEIDKLDKKNYLKLIQDSSELPIQLVLVQWESGI